VAEARVDAAPGDASGGPSGERPRTLRLAHRGDWRGAPENSLAAMEAALELPACDGLEFDVRASRDGVPILLHDPTLRRVQGLDVSPSSLTAEECAALGISSLAEVLKRVGCDPYLDVELKERVPAVIDLLELERGRVDDDGQPALRDAVVSSFDVQVLRWLADERPIWSRWLNAMDLFPPTISLAGELGCQAISVEHRWIDGAGVRRAHEAGLGVAAWTVRSKADYDRLASLGVIAICAEVEALDG
jgi:glycerophosphoryl diester phosphodiesterase